MGGCASKEKQKVVENEGEAEDKKKSETNGIDR